MSAPPAGAAGVPGGAGSEALAHTQQLWGWVGLLLFASFGLTLEILQGLKLGFFLDPDVQLRRELWRLAHAHGALLAVVQLVFSYALLHGRLSNPGNARLASFFFRGALVLLPGGFLLGGAMPSESDPWIGIWLAPVGGAFLILALLVTVSEVVRSRGRS